MPHATQPLDAQDAQDDLLIQQVLNPENTLDISRALEPGEKAEDAVDYGDLSDGDLADEEDAPRTSLPEPEQQGPIHDSLEDLTNEDGNQVTDGNGAFGDEFDDLFGDTPHSASNDAEIVLEDSITSPLPHLESFESGRTNTQDENRQEAFGQRPIQWHQAESIQPRFLQALDTQTVSKEEQMQQYLISMSTHGAVTQESLRDVTRDEDRIQDLATLWPKFERHSVPRFMDMLPQKRSYYVGKKPTKQPKPVYPTKLNLDLAPDHEKQFRLASGPRKKPDAGDEQDGVVNVSPIDYFEADRAEDASLPSDSDNETVGGATWQDLRIVCEDWDNQSLLDSTMSDFSPSNERSRHRVDDDGDYLDTSDGDWAPPPTKVNHGHIFTSQVLKSWQRRKTGHNDWELLHSCQLSLPSLGDPTYTTSKIAKCVTLDLNDPRILVEKTTGHENLRQNTKVSNLKTRTPLIQRYNISNDEAYDLLKENHQSKIRSNLGNPQVEHGLPAVRLQWPYVS